ncbi:nascent polypeptide-associated complex subunit alpha, muscle-specific form-like [Pectinophora gossypiella]|uniref:nascent polypeptide-associated complex subunit alpha, muscle-specific form-like n=1 Tax=Pectinophora gossypiella TaxID=13191 RepID=UPI00214EF934|nr:nascent polypeptide-associated complex subunit alpha, muscle-specific form-like [Pectinophora gossypiella]
MAPPSAGVTKRRARTFVRTRAATTPIAAYAPPPPPRLTGADLRQSPFPLPLPRLPGTGAAEKKRATTPPERPSPPKPSARTTPPVTLSMPSLDMETTPPRTFSFAPTNPFSPPSMSRPDTETTPPRSYAAVLNTNPDSPPHAPPQFRLYQRYLAGLEKATGLSWFAYAPPAERALKLAIKGLPTDTSTTELEGELRSRGYDPQYIRPIQGRVGGIFFVEIRRTLGFESIYATTELLCMPGIKIEAWRGRKGAPQCHRCQQFRHSSHNCHRPAACVRCGESHAAKDCQRPREVPATCCNCGGAHPANSPSCPVKSRELRNTRAGTAPLTSARRAAPATSTVDPSSEPTARSSLMAAANGPNGPKPQRQRRSRKRATPAPTATTTAEPIAVVPVPPQPSTSTETAAAAPPKGKKARPRAEAPPAPSSEKLEVLEQTIQLLHNILAAIRSRTDPVPIIVGGLASLLGQLTGGCSPGGKGVLTPPPGESSTGVVGGHAAPSLPKRHPKRPRVFRRSAAASLLGIPHLRETLASLRQPARDAVRPSPPSTPGAGETYFDAPLAPAGEGPPSPGPSLSMPELGPPSPPPRRTAPPLHLAAAPLPQRPSRASRSPARSTSPPPAKVLAAQSQSPSSGEGRHALRLPVRGAVSPPPGRAHAGATSVAGGDGHAAVVRGCGLDDTTAGRTFPAPGQARVAACSAEARALPPFGGGGTPGLGSAFPSPPGEARTPP